jgi:hypothetical protein
MATRGERSVRFIAVGAVAVAAALVFGLRTPSGSPDWVGIITIMAGVGMIVAGLLAGFRSGDTTHTT